jgi:hypothetical protein
MYFGGWLYPDAPSVGTAAAAVTFSNSGFVWAVTCAHVAHTITAPAKRNFKPFRKSIVSLRSTSLAMFDRQNKYLAIVDRRESLQNTSHSE